MQRLFSTFPGGAPGVGLLLLRLCLSLTLIYFGLPDLAGKLSEPLTLNLLAAAGAIFVLAGLWTPVVGTLISLDEIWIAVHLDPWRPPAWIHVLLTLFSASVVMLGPGAWSIDARLFGRKRFDIDRTRDKRPSL